MTSDGSPRLYPGLLEALDDRPSLGALLSANALHEHRHGSHADAHQLMRRAVATGYPSPACVDRLTIDLVKLGDKAEAAAILRDALARPVPSDSMRGRMTKRLARCAAAAPPPTNDTDELGDDLPQSASGVRQVRPGETRPSSQESGAPRSDGTTRATPSTST